MTKLIPGLETAERVRAAIPDAELEEAAGWVTVDAPHLVAVTTFLKPCVTWPETWGGFPGLQGPLVFREEVARCWGDAPAIK